MPRKETSPELSSLAGRVLAGYRPSYEETCQMAASVLSQDETPSLAQPALDARVPTDKEWPEPEGAE